MALPPSGLAPLATSSTMVAATLSPGRPRQLPTRPSPSHPFLLLHRDRRRRGGGARNADGIRCRRRLLTARGERRPPDEDEDQEEQQQGFDAAVALFNRGEYHACHDVVEELWYGAEDTAARTLLHGILQCAVGFHHLFNQNHRGAMMELGEGLCKLRKLHLEEDGDGDADGPFSLFRDEVAAVLHFLYRTQKELAACTDEMCLTMDGSPSSYQLLGNFAAGQQLYRLEADADGVFTTITFSASHHDDHTSHSQAAVPPRAKPRVKLPRLNATEQHLTAIQCTHQYT